MGCELIRASSLMEALENKDQDAAFFAGGTGIGYKDSGIKADKLIVIPEKASMQGITEEDGCIRIGAFVTFTQALDDLLVPQYLKEALRFCGSLQKRNMATIGGNVASMRSDSYLIPTLIASGARLCLETKDGPADIGCDSYAAEWEKYRHALIRAVLVKPDARSREEEGSVRVLSKRYANTVESHAYLTIAMGRCADEFRIGIAIKGCGVFCPDIKNWDVSWKKAGVSDDMFGTEEYKRYLTATTLETMYEELGGEGGAES